MATKKKRKTSSTATAIKKQEAAQRRAMAAGRRQMTAIVLFAVALFLFFVTVIRGENAWLALHNVLFGLFGICAYVWPFVLGLVAVLCAMDKLYGKVGAKVIEASFMIVLIGSAIDIFSKHADTMTFGQHIQHCYRLGAAFNNGGFFGALIGHPLVAAFGRPGADITVCLLIFVFFMLITGTTLISLFKSVALPVKKLEQHAESTFAVVEEEENAEKATSKSAKKPRFNVDIALDDEQKPAEPPMTDKQKKLIDTYRGTEGEGATAEEIPNEDGSAEDPLIEKINKSIADKKEQLKTGGFTPPEPETIENEYNYPPISLLKNIPAKNEKTLRSEMEGTATRLIETLHSFGIESRIINISRGPSVTRYELQPSAGVRISKITNLSDDIAMSLATAGVRIEAPIPNKAAIGIEVPNRNTSMVGVRELIDSKAFSSAKSKLAVCLGKDIAGENIVTDIAKMPHGLIAGATGSGKSVCINSIIISLLYKATPDEVKLLMIDPKVVELGVYNGIPHLLVPVVTDPRKAAGALGWAVTEMEKRYKIFAEHEVRNLEGYNQLAAKRDDLAKMPHIVIVVDELADLMMTAPKEVEEAICRIAQKARAAGMHLLVATQRPSADIVTGLIKSNIPTRIAFAVSSNVDSRIILDEVGAEKLMGRGDMLFLPVGSTKPTRIQGCFVSDDEVEAVVDYIKGDAKAEYDDYVISEIDRQAVKEKQGKGSSIDSDGDGDPMFLQAVECVVEAGQASTSLLQRRLKLGYARAARIVDEMEQKGIVGPYEGAKPRQVLLSKAQLLEMQADAGE
ncbi:MAG: DNA translocase FtsK 4TM domain-containing protein [Clostridia bacterium]|nr:DNA translocase FtsK 4TM domain-containing protein [Clostridia bacterium]